MAPDPFPTDRMAGGQFEEFAPQVLIQDRLSSGGLPAVALASAADSTEVVQVSETVFQAMRDGDGTVIVAHLSMDALAAVDEILLNLRENPDLTLAMLSFNWGVETVPMDYAEWDRADLLSVIYSSPLSKSILLDPGNRISGVEVSGGSAVVTWTLCGEEWPMALVLEDGIWLVSDLEDF